MSIRLGLFDSGPGGLTVLRRVLERHGSIPLIYLGDTARVPYGSRSPSEIRAIASEVAGWLRQQNVSTVVMACNTTNGIGQGSDGRAGWRSGRGTHRCRCGDGARIACRGSGHARHGGLRRLPRKH